MKRDTGNGRLRAAFVGAVLATTGTSALAFDAGEWIVRAGLAGVFPNDSSGDVAGFPGNGVSVSNGFAVGASLAYMLTPSVGIELLGALPFNHDIKARGPDLGALGTIADTKQLPPTLLLNYHLPMFAKRAFQPYVGVGFNYTLFFDEQPSNSLEGTLGKSDVSLDPSASYALQLGADWDLGSDVMFNVGLWWIDIDTTGTIDFQGDPDDSSDDGRTQVDVEIDPTVLMVGFTKRF